MFAAFRWGGLLKLHGVSALEFPYSVAGLTDQHVKMRWPDIKDPNAPDKPGTRFRMAFARIVTHYFHHNAWLEDGILLRDAHRMAGIPGVLIHGRLDLGHPRSVAGLVLGDCLCPADDPQQLRRARQAQLVAHELHELLVRQRGRLRMAGATDQRGEERLAARRPLRPQCGREQGAQHGPAGPEEPEPLVERRHVLRRDRQVNQRHRGGVQLAQAAREWGVEPVQHFRRARSRDRQDHPFRLELGG